MNCKLLIFALISFAAVLGFEEFEHNFHPNGIDLESVDQVRTYTKGPRKTSSPSPFGTPAPSLEPIETPYPSPDAPMPSPDSFLDFALEMLKQ